MKHLNTRNTWLRAIVLSAAALVSTPTLFQYGCGLGNDYGVYGNPYYPYYEYDWASDNTDASLYWADQWDAYIRE